MSYKIEIKIKMCLIQNLLIWNQSFDLELAFCYIQKCLSMSLKNELKFAFEFSKTKQFSLKIFWIKFDVHKNIQKIKILFYFGHLMDFKKTIRMFGSELEWN